MKLTREMIFYCQTPRGAWNRHQLELLGVSWPPQHGWIERLIGTEISETRLAEVKELGTLSKKERRDTHPRLF